MQHALLKMSYPTKPRPDLLGKGHPQNHIYLEILSESNMQQHTKTLRYSARQVSAERVSEGGCKEEFQTLAYFLLHFRERY